MLEVAFTQKIDLAPILLDENKKLKLFSASSYKGLDRGDLHCFCHYHARYGIVTEELLDMLDSLIKGRSAIEIGAGAGDLGHHLKIKMTDSKIQEDPKIIQQYRAMHQQPITYPEDVEKLEAIKAIEKYQPKVVVASWVTTYSPVQQSYGSSPYGVDENKILNMVDTYIMIGNLKIHGDKPIRGKAHDIISHPGILSRALHPDQNRIFVWNK
jgi:hypothetical protein